MTEAAQPPDGPPSVPPPPPAGYGGPSLPPPGGFGPPSTPPPRGGWDLYRRMGGDRNLFGMLSVLFGILGIGCCCCPWDGFPALGGLPAIVLGVLHYRRVGRGRAGRVALAYAGIALGVLALLAAAFSATGEFHQLRDGYTPY